MKMSLVMALSVILTTTIALAEEWSQYKRDQMHTGWATENLSSLTLAHSIGSVTGRRHNFQVDSITTSGDYVSALLAKTGGLPALPHTGCRGVAHYFRLSMDQTDGGKAYYDTVTPYNFYTNFGGPIETSNGNWAWSRGERKLTFIESGYEMCSITSCQRQWFDTYGIVVGKDDGSDHWRIFWEEWHNSHMWATTDRHGQWSWMRGAPPGNENSRPLGYTIRADAVWANDLLVTNVLLSVLRPQVWNEEEEPPPKHGACGLTAWNGKEVAGERCGQYGMLSTDGDLLFTATQDMRYPGETKFDQYHGQARFAGSAGKITGLVAFELPELEPRWIVDGFDSPPEYQDPPLVGEDRIVWMGRRGGKMLVVAFDKLTGNELWATEVDPWRKLAKCQYYRNSYYTSLAASGDTIIHAGRGLTLLDAATGRIKQQINPKRDGYDAFYMNPIVIDGEVWVIRTEGNVTDMIGAPAEGSQERYILEQNGWHYREFKANYKVMVKFDGEPSEPHVVPRQHTGLSCGGSSIEIYRSSSPVGNKCLLDVDGSGELEVYTDIIYTARELLGLRVPVPNSWRENDPNILPDEQIRENIEKAKPHLDVDGDGTVDVPTDLVALARFIAGLDPPTPELEAHLFAVCPSALTVGRRYK